MVLKEINGLGGKILECKEGRTPSLPVNKLLSEIEFKDSCNLYVIFYFKTVKVQAIFKIIDEIIDDLSEVEEIYSNITK